MAFYLIYFCRYVYYEFRKVKYIRLHQGGKKIFLKIE